MRNLLFVALLVDLGCWSATETAAIPPSSSPTPDAAREATVAPGPRHEAPCSEAGDRLELRVCRNGEDLAWTVTNRTNVALWAFVAPQGVKRPGFDRATVNVHGEAGNVVLSKLPLPPLGGERNFVAAVLLAPGDFDQGSIPVGDRIEPTATNITGAKIIGTREILTVALEVAFAEQRAGDVLKPTQPAPLTLVIRGYAPQELVRSPAVSWK